MSSHRLVPPPPPPLPDRTGSIMADGSVSGIESSKPRTSLPHGTNRVGSTISSSNSSSNSNNANQKRSPGSTRSSQTAGTRVPPPPPPRKNPPPPPPPPRRNATTAATISSNTQPKRRRPIHPPPPPPPPPPPRGMSSSLDSSEALASKAREMLNKCLNRSIPTGNLYSGGLGVYYLLLEESRYQLLMLEKQQILSGTTTNNNPSAATPFRCKKILKQALEGAQSAANRFKRSNSSNLSNQRSNVSLLGGEWIGSHALLAVCYRRLEDFSKTQDQNTTEKTKALLSKGRNPGEGTGTFRGDSASTISSAANRSGTTTNGASLFSRRTSSKGTTNSSGMSVSSTGGTSMVSNAATVATTNPRPRSQRVVDKILHRLEKQHRASDEDDDNITYYTLNSNYTSNTLSSLVVAPIWNQDVLGGRAGALQAIWWLRKEFGDASLAQDGDARLAQELVVSLAVKILVEGLSTAASMGLNDHNNNNNNNNNNN
eukprot:CAMPEP_0116132508 /NCGR_PEP_ID=MMETSP0329-20121206/9587_1 /TAXON_ID=697910 /ORGANISM="Pseudo-nitzschia arenysensis, Strain B593" /LENGTH=485 /DNA_ID=CAMNT_0003627031 /DNA_START=137 /DNA_END=1591 /DNA_ORIENTATION=-